MRQGYLSQYFKGVALKRLSAVEVNIDNSNQHEFNGVEGLRDILGTPDNRIRFATKFLYFSNQDDDPVVEDGFLTWYDARQKARLERGIMRSEYRLYFQNNFISQYAAAGDLLVVAKCSDDTLLVIVAVEGTTTERQLIWLFGLPDLSRPEFSIKSQLETDQYRVGLAARSVLEQIGIEIEDGASDYLDQMLERFGGIFPRTTEFSAYARNTLQGFSSLEDPDAALFAWMEREEILFRTLEKHLLSEKLQDFMKIDIKDTEAFIRLVQSALQRRKSRAGSALENHLEQIFKDHDVTYTRSGVTENKLKPDFIFPCIDCYHDNNYPQKNLTMLAAKATCKDRWRQILSEAARIHEKHLLTFEPGISENQTNEMRGEQVQLVVPRELHFTYTTNQQAWLMNVAVFLEIVQQRQKPA